jgi:hypothetical protein
MLHAGLDLSRRKVDVCLLSAGGAVVVIKRLDRPLGNHGSPFGAHAGGSEPMLHTLNGAYRVGIALQLLGFAGFALW